MLGFCTNPSCFVSVSINGLCSARSYVSVFISRIVFGSVTLPVCEIKSFDIVTDCPVLSKVSGPDSISISGFTMLLLCSFGNGVTSGLVDSRSKVCVERVISIFGFTILLVCSN